MIPEELILKFMFNNSGVSWRRMWKQKLKVLENR
jgi:hypothetical protein